MQGPRVPRRGRTALVAERRQTRVTEVAAPPDARRTAPFPQPERTGRCPNVPGTGTIRPQPGTGRGNDDTNKKRLSLRLGLQGRYPATEAGEQR